MRSCCDLIRGRFGPCLTMDNVIARSRPWTGLTASRKHIEMRSTYRVNLNCRLVVDCQVLASGKDKEQDSHACIPYAFVMLRMNCLLRQNVSLPGCARLRNRITMIGFGNVSTAEESHNKPRGEEMAREGAVFGDFLETHQR